MPKNANGRSHKRKPPRKRTRPRTLVEEWDLLREAGMRRRPETWEKIARCYLERYRHLYRRKRLITALAKDFAGGGWLLAHDEGLSTNQWLWRASRRRLKLDNTQPWSHVAWDDVMQYRS